MRVKDVLSLKVYDLLILVVVRKLQICNVTVYEADIIREQMLVRHSLKSIRYFRSFDDSENSRGQGTLGDNDAYGNEAVLQVKNVCDDPDCLGVNANTTLRRSKTKVKQNFRLGWIIEGSLGTRKKLKPC